MREPHRVLCASRLRRPVPACRAAPCAVLRRAVPSGREHDESALPHHLCACVRDVPEPGRHCSAAEGKNQSHIPDSRSILKHITEPAVHSNLGCVRSGACHADCRVGDNAHQGSILLQEHRIRSCRTGSRKSCFRHAGHGSSRCFHSGQDGTAVAANTDGSSLRNNSVRHHDACAAP